MIESTQHILSKVLPNLEKPKLVEIILRQSEKILTTEKEIEELKHLTKEQSERIKRLEQSLSAALRAQHRQNAPFRREPSRSENKEEASPAESKIKKRPGRKKGHQGSRRQPSQPVNEWVESPLCDCPECKGKVKDIHPIKQIIEEVPTIQLRVVELTTYSGYCSSCDKRVYSTHPLQVSRARGAAKVQLGPEPLPWWLNFVITTVLRQGKRVSY